MPTQRRFPFPRTAVMAALGGGMISAATPLAEISPLVWVLVAISAAGAFITYAIMVYAVWRFRDPSTRRRNYG